MISGNSRLQLNITNEDKKKFLRKIIVCPFCKSPLQESKNGYKCSRHGEFDKQDGFLSFAKSLAKEFDEHWDEQSREIPATKIDVAMAFITPMLDYLANHQDKKNMTIMDVGCGDGVHIVALKKLGIDLSEDSYYLGVDLSTNALKSLQKKAGEKCELLQADAVYLPIDDAVLDCAFSYGVLAYTTDPREAFREMVRVTKIGGIVGVWLYPRPHGLARYLLFFVRALIKAGGRPVAWLIVNSLVPFLGYLPTASKLSLKNATWRQCREVIEVNLIPSSLQYYDSVEIQKWFIESGLKTMFVDHTMPICVWGIKTGC
jgi:ubiquinone/menaquinone biosynthesis C-methylase UbiE